MNIADLNHLPKMDEREGRKRKMKINVISRTNYDAIQFKMTKMICVYQLIEAYNLK